LWEYAIVLGLYMFYISWINLSMNNLLWFKVDLPVEGGDIFC